MTYRMGIAASQSPDLPPHSECDEPSFAISANAGDFLASLNRGQGKVLLDAYISNRTIDNRNALAMHYGLCAQIVARRIYRLLTPDSRRQVEIADVEQTAMALLFPLIEKFDDSLQIPLAAFLIRRLRFALIDQYRREGLMVRSDRNTEQPSRRHVPIERADAVVDPSPGPVQTMTHRETRSDLLGQIPREYRLFVIYRYLRNMQLWQVAKRLNITFETATQLQRQCLARLQSVFGKPTAKRQLAITKTEAPASDSQAYSMPEYRSRRKPIPPAEGVLPCDLQRVKEFRRWMLLRVPWAYRKLVAYRYLRGRDINWTASRLGICPNRARLLDRQARPMLVRVVEDYKNNRPLAAVA